MKNKELSLPEQYVKSLNDTFCMAISEIGSFKKHAKGKNAPYDQTKVLVTLAQAKNALRKPKFGKIGLYDYMVGMLAGGYAFTRTKQVFRVDEKLQEELGKATDMDADVPCSILMNLPYPCFWLELPEKDSTIGIMVHMDYGKYNKDSDASCYALWFYMNIYDNGELNDSHGLMLRLPLIEGKSLIECVKESCSDFDSESKQIMKRKDIDVSVDIAAEWVKVVNVLLYICSVNADIIPEEELLEQQKMPSDDAKLPAPGESSIEKNAKQKSAKEKKPVNKEHVWNVGYRIGAELKKHVLGESESTPSRKGTGQGSVKRAHVRRGHFHHYWAGSLKDDSRHLIVKWIPPVVIHAEFENQLPVVQHYVR